MKYFYYILLFMLIGSALQGQDQTVMVEGAVTFLSSRNVYVKFASTKNINIGDTLFVKQNAELIPALVVGNKSSSSIVCTPLLSEKMKVSDEVYAKTILKKEKPEAKKEQPKDLTTQPSIEKDVAISEKVRPVITPEEDEEPFFKQKINGQISVASYSSLSDYKNTDRMRYSFSFRGSNLKNSRFSTDNYFTFRHTLGEWGEVKDNLSQALKVYALAVKYDIDSTSSLTFGRKINPQISSLGAIDGFQYEKSLGKLRVGAIVGSRPGFSDYSLDLNLLQVGAYATYSSNGPAASFQHTTFGFIEQRNKAKVDRRFVYFQHSSELLKNLNLFSSFEVDLYENINNEATNALRLANFFLSLRYRLSRKWAFSVSYDNRNNIIYYESYKNYIDQLIEDETRQGLRFGFNSRPFKFLTWGANASWRFQKSDLNLSKNLNTYCTFSKIPVLDIRTSLTANFLQASYLDSRMFGIRLSKEIVRKMLTGDLYYRFVDYQYKTSGNSIRQNIAGASLSLRILKKLTLHLYYEGTFDDRGQAYHRINTRIIQRF